MKKILFIVGSLRKQSFNKQLAIETERLIKNRAEVSFFSLENVPFINQDEEYPAPKGVQELRDAVNGADAVWFFTPEYNGQVPGLLKNTVDWLSRPIKPYPAKPETTIAGKKVTFSGAAGKSGSANFQALLKNLLTFVGANLLDNPTTKIVIPMESWMTNKINWTKEQDDQIEAQIEAFLKFIA